MNAIFLLKNKGDVAFLYDDYSVRQGLEKLRVHGYTAIPVITQDGDYVGCISEGDFLWHMINSKDNNIRNKEDIPILEIMRKDFNPAVRIDVSMEELLNRAIDQNFVPVTDDRNKFIGIITRKDIIAYFKSLFVESETDPNQSNYRALNSTINI